MASKGSGLNPAKSHAAPSRNSLPAPDVQRFRVRLGEFLDIRDVEGRRWADSEWGVYAFYDFDGEPIYVGQTNEQLRTRVRRHLTNQRTDAVAMRVLDVMEVAEVEIWPLWHLADQARVSREGKNRARRALDAYEYSAYLGAIERSKFKAILNEKIPPVSQRVDMPPSLRYSLVSDDDRTELGHPDIRIARRAETISRLSDVVRERGEVSDGLRRVLVIQAIRLTYLAAERLAYVEHRPLPRPTAIDPTELVGNTLIDSD